MQKVLLVTLLGLTLISSAASAETLTKEMLTKDFENCMGDELKTGNAQREEYCHCVVDEMSKWTVETYGTAATEQSKAGLIPSTQSAAIAKECISKVLK